MTDEQIINLVSANATDMWTGDSGIPEGKAPSVIRYAIKEQQKIIDQQSIEIAQKDAKIYAYEAIIANSNFKAVLPKKQEGKK